ncbi:helix-turn-helix domain-containing protein [Litoreibacter sp.]|nr:helix-turn-helix domain-containing protein [Litoreibacter sp.]
MSKNTIYAAFGDNMSARRKQLKLTQSDLASRTGLSRASIANMERGHQNVALHHLYAIAIALKVASVSDLLPSLGAATDNQGEENMILTSEAVSNESRESLNNMITKALKQGDRKRQGR